MWRPVNWSDIDESQVVGLRSSSGKCSEWELPKMRSLNGMSDGTDKSAVRISDERITQKMPENNPEK